ncbi:acyl-coenzyme A thioesterase 2, chloroplastic-like [Euphorbia lathyris]|uniref:acyl-coenzyme A thioesterase 2, chloroplastic-like n=1 Tax=Euphorbia lathyris TaxID=212925 RepID=UPI003313966B
MKPLSKSFNHHHLLNCNRKFFQNPIFSPFFTLTPRASHSRFNEIASCNAFVLDSSIPQSSTSNSAASSKLPSQLHSNHANSSNEFEPNLIASFSNRQTRSCLASGAVSTSKSHSVDLPINRIHISKLLKQSKPAFYAPIHFHCIPRRCFSSEIKNPHIVSTATTPLESSAPIDAGSSIRKPISLWPGMYHSPVTNALWEARSSIFESPADSPLDGSSSGELETKTPSKSRTSILYSFSSDYVLREQYRNPWNEIRMGKLVEDLDALAGTISYKHCCNEDGMTRPLLLVTASVDRIVLKKPIKVDADLKIVGAVTWVGRSSMEIQLEVTQSTKGTSSPSDTLALVANFTFVARDSRTGKSAPVNRLSPETEQEKLLWEEAEERNKMRKKQRVENKGDATDRDIERVNALLAEGRVFCDMPALADRDSILIKDTSLQNSLMCQPQQRNIHGRIFGGFLMRKAFELAFATAYAFAGAKPYFVEVDHVDFFRPVDVGNFLRLKSCVLYTELEDPARPLINVEVVAHVTSPEQRSSEVSNTFYFTFTVRPEAMKDGLRIRNVVPATEEEARRVIERMDAEIS